MDTEGTQPTLQLHQLDTLVWSDTLVQLFQQLLLQLLLLVTLAVSQLATPTLLATKSQILLTLRAAGTLPRQLLMPAQAEHTAVSDTNPCLVARHRPWIQRRKLTSGIS